MITRGVLRTGSAWISGRRRVIIALLKLGVGLLLPTLAFYALRRWGFDVYVSLLVPTLVSAVPGLVSVVRERRVDTLSTYFTAMLLGGLVVSLVGGDERFLLARDAVLTGVTGVWFITSLRGHRPLAYVFTRPLLQNRFRWPDDWDGVWSRSPRFRRMWRVSSVLYGAGLLLDATVRVVLAYGVDPDRVPAIGLGVSVLTVVVLAVVTNAYYVRCRVHDPRSPLRRGDPLP